MKLKKIIASVMAVATTLVMFGNMAVVNAAHAPKLSLSTSVVENWGSEYLAVEISYSGFEGLKPYKQVGPTSYEGIGISSITAYVENDSDLVYSYGTESCGTAPVSNYVWNGSKKADYIVNTEGVLGTLYFEYDSSKEYDVDFSFGECIMQVKDSSNNTDVVFKNDQIEVAGCNYTNATEPAGPTFEADVKLGEVYNGKRVAGVSAAVTVPDTTSATKLVYNLKATGTEGGVDINKTATIDWPFATYNVVTGTAVGFAVNVENVPETVTISLETVTAE